MLIILTAWFIHNWWKFLIGLLMVIVILEGSHRKKVAAAKSAAEDTAPADPVSADTCAADPEESEKLEEKSEEETEGSE